MATWAAEVRVREFAMPSEDWMSVSVLRPEAPWTRWEMDLVMGGLGRPLKVRRKVLEANQKSRGFRGFLISRVFLVQPSLYNEMIILMVAYYHGSINMKTLISS